MCIFLSEHLIKIKHALFHWENKKLSYCLETARDNGRGNDNLDWNEWPLNVLQGHQKWHQSKSSVWFPISTLQ